METDAFDHGDVPRDKQPRRLFLLAIGRAAAVGEEGGVQSSAPPAASTSSGTHFGFVVLFYKNCTLLYHTVLRQILQRLWELIDAVMTHSKESADSRVWTDGGSACWGRGG